MARTPKSLRFYKRAETALLAAIELYNKPDFNYREEAFSILALNAWELLLKGKLLRENNNRVRCLYLYDQSQTKGGRPSLRKKVRRNRSGTPQTLALGKVIAELENKGVALSKQVKHNLVGLVEIRDSAVHFVDASPKLTKQVLELGTASVRNFIELSKQWFRQDLSAYHLYLMPIGFVGAPSSARAISVSLDEGRLLEYLTALIGECRDEPNADFHVALEVSISMKRSSPTDATASVAITNDPSAQRVMLSEEDVRKQYPWDYRELTSRLYERYHDFKANAKYHDTRRPLLVDRRFVKSRYLDPGNPKSPRKDFYNPNIVAEFDKIYSRG